MSVSTLQRVFKASFGVTVVEHLRRRRLETARRALLSDGASVAEAAAIGRPDEIKGQAIAVFVTLKDVEPTDELRQELRLHVRKEIGALAQPDDIRFTNALPKTRSGKIMRRLLRDIAAGREIVQDTTTLEDYSVLARLRGEDE